MQVEINGKIYDVHITRKNNKNMYLRVKEDGIHITCNYLMPKSMIKSFIENNPLIIEKFNNAIQKGLDFVHNNDSKTIAEIIKSEFPDTKIEDLITAIDQYKKTDTWPQTTNFTEDSFNHMQDIMINAKQLEKKVNYQDLIYQVK